LRDDVIPPLRQAGAVPGGESPKLNIVKNQIQHFSNLLLVEGKSMSETSLYYVKLMVGDAEALAPFYRDVFGMREIRRIFQPEHVRPHLEIYLSAGSTEQLCLMEYINKPAPQPGEVRIAFTVKNVDAAVSAAQAGGGSIVLPAETLEAHNFRWATIADPEGHTIEVMQFGL
jgi:lactoylglutathione lyase